MATLLQEEEKDKEQGGQTQVSGGLTGNTGGTGAAASGGNTQAGSGSSGLAGSGRSQNLKKYVEANQGFRANEGGLAGSIQDTVANKAQDTRDQLAQRQEQFGQSQQQLQQQVGDDQLVQTAFQDPQQLLNQQDKFQQFQNLRDRGYQQDIQGLNTDVSGLQTQASNLERQAQQAQSEQGRFQLLRDSFGNPTYTQGQQKLDQLLLQAAPGQLNQLESGLQQATAGLGQDVSQFGQQATQQQQALMDLSNQQAQNIAARFGQFGAEGGGAFGDLYGDLTSQQAAAEQAQADLVSRAQEQLGAGQLDADIAQQLGIDATTRTYGLDPMDYVQNINAADQSISLADAASQDQLGRLDALRQLAGLEQSDINIGQREGESGLSFDQQGLQDAIAAREAAYNQAMQDRTFDSSRINSLFNLEGGNLGDAAFSQMLQNRNYADVLSDLESGEFGRDLSGVTTGSPEQIETLRNFLETERNALGYNTGIQVGDQALDSSLNVGDPRSNTRAPMTPEEKEAYDGAMQDFLDNFTGL